MESCKFLDFNFNQSILNALADISYMQPTAIQSQSIPILNDKHDLIAQAQTGTGKTAAFCLPILQNIEIKCRQTQALILVPTRELAMQVSDSLKQFAKYLPDVRIVSIYGGQDYRTQLKLLKQGAHIVVGTPGRTMDHMRRGTLKLDQLSTLVLDEADEMLRMGFIDDVEWVLSQIEQKHQTALFSATMPDAIKKIAQTFLIEPKKVHITPKQTTVKTIQQFYIQVSQKQKISLLTGFLTAEDIDAAIIFVRTKQSSSELADKLMSHGFNVAALNGDMPQAARTQTIERIKSGKINIIVATDVAARGIDVSRVSHVINYDVPFDAEPYVHRIGRTGRAGRTGKAISFIGPRDRRFLDIIKKQMGVQLQAIKPPSFTELKQIKLQQVMDKIGHAMQQGKKLQSYHELVAVLEEEYKFNPADIAAAALFLMHDSKPLVAKEIVTFPEEKFSDKKPRKRNREKSFKKKKSGRKPKSSKVKAA